jgi:L-glutamine:scyllo-inosose aminotransferase/L-glutamine:2-deoxy-scyllo-inosose/3-amino-2,3-dideoxy-scyllo-inosose aminotransferase
MIVVHPYCTVADLDAFVQLSSQSGIPLIEDCSQAHGATWRHRRVGAHGAIGVFSMQESKVLTCGEGGAAITSDEGLFEAMEQLRADGRRYVFGVPELGRPELEEVGGVQGQNFCLSEIHAAILLDRLTHLKEEIALREENGAHLRALLADVGGITPLQRPEAVGTISYWRFTCRLDLEMFGNWSVENLCAMLSTEIGVQVKPVDSPITDSVLYQPLLTGFARGSLRERLERDQFDLPEARAARASCIRIPHRVLLAGRGDIQAIAAAFVATRKAALANPQ